MAMITIPGLWRLNLFLNKTKEIATYQFEKLIYKPWIFPNKTELPMVVFIGASITKQWLLDIRFPFIRIIDIYNFDKSEAIAKILKSPSVPQIVFIKECAAYFPGNLADYKSMIEGWCERLKDGGVKYVVPVTVVPVTEAHSKIYPGRIEAIWKYNDWLREYVSKGDGRILDFELALIESTTRRYLKTEYAQKDGLHINRKGYRKVLDPLLGSFLASLI